jgi:hypothetical protein
MVSPWFPRPLDPPKRQQQQQDAPGDLVKDDTKPKLLARALGKLSRKSSTRHKDAQKESSMRGGKSKRGQIPAQEARFPFLRLPPELRNRVYEYVFASPANDEISPWEPPKPASHWLQPLLACRAIYNEAALIAFSSVVFIVHHLPGYDDLRERFARLSEAQIQSIRYMAMMATCLYHSFNNSDNTRAVWFYMRNVGLQLKEVLIWCHWPANDMNYDNFRIDRASFCEVIFYFYRFVPSLRNIVVYCDSLSSWEAIAKRSWNPYGRFAQRLEVRYWPDTRYEERDLVVWDVVETATGKSVQSFRVRRSTYFNRACWKGHDERGNIVDASPGMSS